MFKISFKVLEQCSLVDTGSCSNRNTSEMDPSHSLWQEDAIHWDETRSCRKECSLCNWRNYHFGCQSFTTYSWVNSHTHSFTYSFESLRILSQRHLLLSRYYFYLIKVWTTLLDSFILRLSISSQLIESLNTWWR